MAKIPARAEHQRKFVALDMAERRAIIRAVNRGLAVNVRKHAPLAVGVARRQQRFWRYAWLIGPVMGLAQLLFFSEPEAALGSGLFGTLVLVLIAWFWRSRAQRAEIRNLEIVEGRRSPGDNQESVREAAQRRRGWGRSGGRAASADAATTGSDGADEPSTPMRPVRGHLPGRAGAESPPEHTPGGPSAGSPKGSGQPPTEPETLDPSRRPYRPRGRKRRT